MIEPEIIMFSYFHILVAYMSLRAFDDLIYNNNILIVSNFVANTTLCPIAPQIWDTNTPPSFKFSWLTWPYAL